MQFGRKTLEGFGHKHLLKVCYEMSKQSHDTESFSRLNVALECLNSRGLSDYNFVDSEDDLQVLQVQLERALKIDIADTEFLVSHKDTKQAKGMSMPVALLLENFRSSYNVGSCFRSAESFLADELVLTGYSPTPENSKSAKAALGSDEWISWRHHESTEQALSQMRSQGRKVYAVETAEHSKNLGELEISFPCVFLLGNEKFGLSEQSLRLCDEVVKIPLYGRKNSLNVAVCAGILLYECRRQYQER